MTRENVDLASKVATKMKELHQEKYPELMATQDIREHRKILEWVNIDPMEDIPAEWEDTPMFRCAPLVSQLATIATGSSSSGTRALRVHTSRHAIL